MVAPHDVAPSSQISFRWDAVAGSRQIQGVSDKRGLHWHYGVSVSVRSRPLLHVPVVGRLIFSQDGQEPLSDAARMHRLRRSFAKSWRNARWRDMMLAFLYWMAEGKNTIVSATGSDDRLALNLPPIGFTPPISIPVQGETSIDEADVGDDEEGPLEDESSETLGDEADE